MRIVDVCAFYSPAGGGVRTYIHNKMRAAATRGHELIVLAPGPRETVIPMDSGSVLHTIAAPSMPLDRRYHYFDDEAALHQALDRWAPDHVEASSPWSSATMVGRWPGPATRSLVMHADPLASYAYRWFGPVAERDRIDRWFDRFWRHLRGLDGMFDVLVTPNEDYRQRLIGGGLRKVVNIPLGVDGATFSPKLRSTEVRRSWLDQLGLGPEAILLIAVGRFSAEKRWPMVIRAVGDAARSTAVGLVLVGDGPQQAKLNRLVRRRSNVVLAGPIADRRELATLMASADALVHGCESETFCLVASEAKASGIPIIVPDRGGASSLLEPGRGERYRAANRRDLTRAIVNLAAHAHSEQPEPPKRSVRTLDQHFAELFALYCIGLPLSDGIVATLSNLLGA